LKANQISPPAALLNSLNEVKATAQLKRALDAEGWAA
jgi:hypothetical protein